VSDTRFERYEFTDKEIAAMKDELPQKVARLGALQDAKKLTTKELGEEIKRLEKEVFTLSEKVNSGFEMREVELQQALPFATTRKQ